MTHKTNMQTLGNKQHPDHHNEGYVLKMDILREPTGAPHYVITHYRITAYGGRHGIVTTSYDTADLALDAWDEIDDKDFIDWSTAANKRTIARQHQVNRNR